MGGSAPTSYFNITFLCFVNFKYIDNKHLNFHLILLCANAIYNANQFFTPLVQAYKMKYLLK